MIEDVICTVRGQRVILDADLAKIYGTPTSRFNEAVKRNRERFPEDFLFQLTRGEVESLISQNAMSKPGRGGRRSLPYAFTEHGAVMAANILRSPRAVEMSVFVVRAFIKMRQVFINQKDLAHKLSLLEHQLTKRMDKHEEAIVRIIEEIDGLMNPPERPPPSKKKIGFHGDQ